MNIGILCHSSMGGSVRIALELTKELANRGHRVHLFTRTTPFGYVDNQDGVILHPIVPNHEDRQHPAMLYLDWSTAELHAFLSSLLRVVQEEKLDILHFHYAIPFAFIAAELKKRLGQDSPLLIGTLHGTDVSIWGRDPDKGPHLAKILPEMDGLTTVSQSHAQLATDVFKLSIRPEVIPNFVDLSLFTPRSRDEHIEKQIAGVEKQVLGKKEKVRICHVSNFRPVKDLQSVAYIFSGIREKMNAELWLVGDGQEMEVVKSIVKEKEMERQVRYWGIRSDVAPILALCDLFIISSRAESFCMAALEAMACGIPVLSTEVGGLPEVVTHGKTGLLFPVGDHSSAVNQALNLLSDPASHRAMSKAAVAHAGKFTKEIIVTTYEKLYERLLYKSA